MAMVDWKSRPVRLCGKITDVPLEKAQPVAATWAGFLILKSIARMLNTISAANCRGDDELAEFLRLLGGRKQIGLARERHPRRSSTVLMRLRIDLMLGKQPFVIRTERGDDFRQVPVEFFILDAALLRNGQAIPVHARTNSFNCGRAASAASSPQRM